MRPEFEIIGEESSGRADYAIKSDSDNLGSACQVVFNIKKLKFLVKNIIKLTQRVGSSSCGLWDRTYSDEEPDRKRKNSTDISAENTEFRARVVTLERDIDDL
ncbi:hypothetical protein GLOIN_2v1783548 [Rhizophagus irregularis DAOM 181602=DAOM 197198]|uniref:Uncharacterized protein n=1 Tax=Rhizophagus irregularis (strain DAOM 181602 / DAOM 197198 / MUCL 43194) TaxID=747089 RepID=A0A2P4PEP7_RHIID|nr:hypothetical protein GLOIN_2v1783548 [Rhizophagus irregularis DAOM 181602=DAOM 197198]POG63858.1 hypothetical protein GLOIN_2v1783548 [Rhizophagus irregularis DAOM 181602=DAOM 197198]|eukprot:XP_025170724.1 hypothetical protein GLOIN_2v1783548 [Rhizophagus irregularis DAOM 181602=DAOM 197198]